MMAEVQTVGVPVHLVNEGEKRLDAGFYAQDVVNARILIDRLRGRGVRINEMGDLSSRIFWPGRFKRVYVSEDTGDPFLTPSEVFMFLPKARKFVTDFPKEALVKKNWLLITRSGSIGRCLVATKYLGRFILSDDLIRVIPKSRDNIEYAYIYLNTWIGQAFLTKDRYGATVKHIEPHHVANIPIPLITEFQEEIGSNILEVHRLREEAQADLLDAEGMIYSKLKLPKIDEEDIEYFGGEKGRTVKSFEIKASALSQRLDASYHLPLVRKATSFLSNSSHGTTAHLAELANSSVPPRFKRPYVKDTEQGIPLLQGAHIPLIKPLGIKSIWRRMKNIDAYIIRKNWILVTASGTIGRLSFVSNYWDGWAATNHLLRIIANEERIHPGYLAAFLLTEILDIHIKHCYN